MTRWSVGGDSSRGHQVIGSAFFHCFAKFLCHRVASVANILHLVRVKYYSRHTYRHQSDNNKGRRVAEGIWYIVATRCNTNENKNHQPLEHDYWNDPINHWLQHILKYCKYFWVQRERRHYWNRSQAVWAWTSLVMSEIFLEEIWQETSVRRGTCNSRPP